jgi:hypothetical protein
MTDELPPDPFETPGAWRAFERGYLLWEQLIALPNRDKVEDAILAMDELDLQTAILAAVVNEKDREFGDNKDGLHKWANSYGRE